MLTSYFQTIACRGEARDFTGQAFALVNPLNAAAKARGREIESQLQLRRVFLNLLLLLRAKMEAQDQKQHEDAAPARTSAPLSEKNLDNETTAPSSDESSLAAALDTIQASDENVEATQQSATVRAEAETPVRNSKGIKWIICVLSIFSSVFLYALDNTVVATIQPAIINHLHHIEKLPWVSVAFQVTSVALDLTWYVHPFPGKCNLWAY